MWHAHKLGDALGVARQENKRAAAVTDFLREVLRMASPERARGRQVTVEQALDEASRAVGEMFKGQPMTEAEVRTIIGEIYFELGKFGRAEHEHRAALALREAALGPDHLDTAASRHFIANALRPQGFPLMGLPYARKAFEVRKSRLGAEHRDTLASMELLAWSLSGRRQSAADLAIPTELVEIRSRTSGRDHPDTLIAKARLAQILEWHGRRPEALNLHREAAAGLRNALGTEDTRTLHVLINFAAALQLAGELDEAEALYQQVLEARARVLGPTHIRTRKSMYWLANLMLVRGAPCDAWEARDILERLRAAQKVTGEAEYQRYETYEAMTALADAVEACGEPEAAQAMRLEMIQTYRREWLDALRRNDLSGPPTPVAHVRVGEWKDLLDGVIDPSRHAVRGRWQYVRGGLRVEKALFARLAIPVDVRGSYELEVTFSRTGGSDAMKLFLPVGEGDVCLDISVFGRRNGLQYIWFKDAHQKGNRTASPGQLENDRNYTLLVTVQLLPERRARVEARLDGVPCIAGWEGPQAALQSEAHLPAAATLALGAHDAEYVFHSVRLRMIDGEANLVKFGADKLEDPWWTGDENPAQKYLLLK
jgi:tetratricopeptide (TPR) repeat protein